MYVIDQFHRLESITIMNEVFTSYCGIALGYLLNHAVLFLICKNGVYNI